MVSVFEEKSMITVEDQVVERIARSYRMGGKLIIFGNGGSLADASHIAAEYVGRYVISERRALSAFALNDPIAMSAIANDYGFDHVFSRQIEAHCKPEDIVIVMTTSDVSQEENGHSRNIYNGIMAARDICKCTIGFGGRESMIFRNLVDYFIEGEGENTARIQESHMRINHEICGRVEKMLHKEGVI